MTDLTLELLRSELAPIREELAFIRRAVTVLQQEIRSIKAAFNELRERRDA